MECGFCEPVCSSMNLSFIPRQRNTVSRKIQTLDCQQKQRWLKDYEYFGIQTCATTSLCKTRCPVDIDTGAFILSKKLDSLDNLKLTKKFSKIALHIDSSTCK